MRNKKSLSLSEKRKKLAEQKKQRKAKRQNLKAANPPQGQLSVLLEHYQNERFGDAEKLAISISREFPQHVFAWKVLGAVLGKTGRKSGTTKYRRHRTTRRVRLLRGLQN